MLSNIDNTELIKGFKIEVLAGQLHCFMYGGVTYSSPYAYVRTNLVRVRHRHQTDNSIFGPVQLHKQWLWNCGLVRSVRVCSM